MNGFERDDVAFSLEQRCDKCSVGLQRELWFQIDWRELPQFIHRIAQVLSGAAIDESEFEVLEATYIDLMPGFLDDAAQLRGRSLGPFALCDVNECDDDACAARCARSCS